MTDARAIAKALEEDLRASIARWAALIEPARPRDLSLEQRLRTQRGRWA